MLHGDAQLVEFGPRFRGFGRFLPEDGVAPGFVEGAELYFQVLVAGWDAGVADIYGPSTGSALRKNSLLYLVF